ncbi:MAG TPA: TonB-dependent receptor [Phenylobacterium sp.]
MHPVSAQPATDGVTLDQVVVTAQRRPELAADVPISLTVARGEALDVLQATEMAGLGKVVPSLVMMRTGAFTQPYLRGVGKRSTLGVENGVATYVDGVYLGSSISALMDLRGMERVEVLNGPQGTLFGRNSTGGVIQVVTRDPSPDLSGQAEFHLGSYGHVRGDGYLTGGSDRLAANLEFSLSRNDGYGRNLFTGETNQGATDHSIVARSKWIWRPADGITLTLAADYQDIDRDFSQRPVDSFPPIGAPRVLDFRDGDQDGSNDYHFQYGGASVRTDVDVGEVTFMSLTALRQMRAQYGADLDQGPEPLLAAAVNARQEQFSQEFQLQSDPAARISWVAGLYYIKLDERYDPTGFVYGGAYAAQRGGRIAQVLFATGRVSSYAGYGQGTLPLGERVRLTGGMRYTIEERSVRAQGEQQFDTAPFVRPIPGLPPLTAAPLRKQQTFRELTWRASLDWDISDDVLGYVSSSRGFQSGGWNLQTPQSPAFRPESLVAVEAGLKFAAPTGRLSADASVFYYDYADLQVSAFTPLGSVTTNAASAHIYGLEAQLAARLSASTRITLGGQLLEARFKAFKNATCTDYSPGVATPYLPLSCDVTGNRLPFAPKFKLNLGASHTMSLGHAGTLVLNGNFAQNSGYYSEADNVVRQRPFATIDVSGEWRPQRDGPSVRLWVLNLTDSRYYDSLVTFPTTGVLQRPAAPRRFGVSVAYEF